MVRTAITKEEPSRELKVLRQRVAELEALEAKHQQADKKSLQFEDEQRYKAVFEFANDVIVLMDKKGRVTDVNDKLREILGLEGKNW
jgi:PAS domain-containing protein